MGSKKKNSGVKKWAILSAIGIEMGVIIYLFIQLGLWLDKRYLEDGKWFLILGTFFGIAISLYLVIQQTNRLNS
jgi:F0F1-type ATP synthase assembly protein I